MSSRNIKCLGSGIFHFRKYCHPKGWWAVLMDNCRLSTLDFQKKRFFFKRFQFLKKKKKKALSREKKVFLHQQFQILELKKGFVLKKKEGFFHHQFPTLLQAS